MDRRQFLMTSLGAGSLMFLPSFSEARSPLNSLFIDPIDMSPLEKLSAFGGSKTIEGDLPDEAHEIFWDKPGYLRKKGGIPAASAHYDVVIVGGGMAGLSAAYELRSKKVLLIEGNPRLGGNSRSQNVGRSYISQGAAYFAAFEAGDEFDRLYTDLGVKRSFRNTAELDEPIMMNGRLIKNFWSGSSDPAKAADIRRAKEIIKDVFDHKLPELPLWDRSSSARTYLNSLDQMTFATWLQRELGTVHPHVMEMITLYCWSSFAGTPSEISAAQGLNFFASDTFGGTNVLPGGNGMLAQAMYQKTAARGNVTFRSNCFGADVRKIGSNVQVCFKNENNALETVTATKCIIASPKKVAKFIVENIPADQRKAMDAINYRAYLVANLFLNTKISSPGYDVYSLQGKDASNTKTEVTNRVVPDILFADWAGRDSVDRTILTAYVPLPYDMAQQYIFIDGLHEKYEARLKTAIAPNLAGLGLSWSNVAGMRLVRYGHSVPLAKMGQIADGTFERASRDVDGCIYFANQDNWGNPCFETSYGSALEAVRKC